MLTKILKITIQIQKKVLIVFDDMIADIINNKKLNPIVTELFIKGRKLNISITFITKSFFYYENYKQQETSANCFKSFIRY